MKLLKDEIREAIVESAKKEFFLNGYEKTSMRSIAKGTTITVGNIYKYFENKESLFSYILDPVYLDLVNLIKHHDDDLEHDKNYSIDKFIEDQGAILLNLLKEKRIELLILIDGSDGSKYEGIKNQMILLLSAGARNHLLSYYSRLDDSVAENFNINTLACAIAQCFIEGFFALIRNSDDPKEIEESGTEFIKLFFNGFKNIL